MARGQKIGMIALFASAFVCIGFATLRVIQISTKTGNKSSPSATWLGLWTLIEASIAICIGCCPAFAVLYRTSCEPHDSYDTHGYSRCDQSRSLASRDNPNGFGMNKVTVGMGPVRAYKGITSWNDGSGSQEELAMNRKGIRVTTTAEQDHTQSHVLDVLREEKVCRPPLDHSASS